MSRTSRRFVFLISLAIISTVVYLLWPSLGPIQKQLLWKPVQSVDTSGPIHDNTSVPPEGALITREDGAQVVYRSLPRPSGLDYFDSKDDDIANLRIDVDTSSIRAEENFYSLLQQRHLQCVTSKRLGRSGDGGWNVCLEGPYRPGPNCTVYSFGIGFDWSFDDAMSKHYNCQVKSFDPSMRGIKDHKRSKGVYFFKTGLAGSNFIATNGWHMKTLGTILAEFGDEKVIIDYLKIDIESTEWDAFEAIFKENVLPRVKQLGFEIHTSEMKASGGGGPSEVRDYARYWRVLDGLHELGFRKWYQHENPMGFFKSPLTGLRRSCCYELVYINTRFLERTHVIPPLNVSLPYKRITPHPLFKDHRPKPDFNSSLSVESRPTIKPVPPVEFNFSLAKGFHLTHPLVPVVVDYDLTARAAEEEFYRFVKKRNIACPHHSRVGNIRDGGWDLCLANPYQLKQPCLAYSFGIGTDWSFDDAISKQYGCEVRAFDPSIAAGNYKRSHLVWFYQMGLSGHSSSNSKGWKTGTFGKILHQLGHSQRTIDVLKLDIEYSEWDSLQAMFLEGSLKRVKQLVMEIHTRDLHKTGPTTVSDFVTYGTVLQSLENMGFVRWHANQNNLGRFVSEHSHTTRSCCWNLYYVNLNFMKESETLA